MRQPLLCPRCRARASTRELQYDALLAAYQRRGGLAPSEGYACTGVRFAWQTQTWLPLFQFEGAAQALHPAVAAVLAELDPVLDDWDIALWFAEPNSWLDDGVPADLLNGRAADVIEAARADRFIARG